MKPFDAGARSRIGGTPRHGSTTCARPRCVEAIVGCVVSMMRRATLVNCYDVSSGSSSTLTAMPYGKNRTLRDGSVLVLFARNASSSVAYTCST
jgi:hypothetical protein